MDKSYSSLLIKKTEIMNDIKTVEVMNSGRIIEIMQYSYPLSLEFKRFMNNGEIGSYEEHKVVKCNGLLEHSTSYIEIVYNSDSSLTRIVLHDGEYLARYKRGRFKVEKVDVNNGEDE